MFGFQNLKYCILLEKILFSKKKKFLGLIILSTKKFCMHTKFFRSAKSIFPYKSIFTGEKNAKYELSVNQNRWKCAFLLFFAGFWFTLSIFANIFSWTRLEAVNYYNIKWNIIFEAYDCWFYSIWNIKFWWALSLNQYDVHSSRSKKNAFKYVNKKTIWRN